MGAGHRERLVPVHGLLRGDHEPKELNPSVCHLRVRSLEDMTTTGKGDIERKKYKRSRNMVKLYKVILTHQGSSVS